MHGIIYYLKVVLQEPQFRAPNNISAEVWKQNFVEEILRVFEKQQYKDLAYLVLKNNMLREHCTHKLINVLKEQTYK